MKTMKTYNQPVTEIIDYKTLDLCGNAGQLYSASVVGGSGEQAMSPARWPVFGTYTTKTLYI